MYRHQKASVVCQHHLTVENLSARADRMQKDLESKEIMIRELISTNRLLLQQCTETNRVLANLLGDSSGVTGYPRRPARLDPENISKESVISILGRTGCLGSDQGRPGPRTRLSEVRRPAEAVKPRGHESVISILGRRPLCE